MIYRANVANIVGPYQLGNTGNAEAISASASDIRSHEDIRSYKLRRYL